MSVLSQKIYYKKDGITDEITMYSSETDTAKLEVKYLTSGTFTFVAPKSGMFTYEISGGSGGGGGYGGTWYSNDDGKVYRLAYGGAGGNGYLKKGTTILVKGHSYTCVVGSGGVAGTDKLERSTGYSQTVSGTNGTSGGSSSFNGVVASGGGYGGYGTYTHRRWDTGGGDGTSHSSTTLTTGAKGAGGTGVAGGAKGADGKAGYIKIYSTNGILMKKLGIKGYVGYGDSSVGKTSRMHYQGSDGTVYQILKNIY